MKGETYDHERISFNLARLKKAGEKLEVAVDPDLAIAFRQGKDVDIKEVIRSEKIFSDVKKGLLASETFLQANFKTTDTVEIAKKIIQEGEIQLTLEYKQKLREDKKRKIINLIARNGMDPRTKLPHPPQRIESAIEQAKVSIDEFKSAEDQMQHVIDKIRSVLPISIELKKIEIIIPPQYAGRAYSMLSRYGKPREERWNSDGSYQCKMEIPAGLLDEFFDKVNGFTSGEAMTTIER